MCTYVITFEWLQSQLLLRLNAHLSHLLDFLGEDLFCRRGRVDTLQKISKPGKQSNRKVTHVSLDTDKYSASDFEEK